MGSTLRRIGIGVCAVLVVAIDSFSQIISMLMDGVFVLAMAALTWWSPKKDD